MVAAQEGNSETVEMLLAAGATVNYQDKVTVIPDHYLTAFLHNESSTSQTQCYFHRITNMIIQCVEKSNSTKIITY